jgi:hypothetical protein
MNACEVKQAKECHSQTKHFDYVGWVCEPCYHWLLGH